ncbi:hypothetical protein TrVE_jg4960 [Triparma verrucosa]|uniref:Uncharacterized protein n=1 Tax=Triparma verrucosa TaxID=1606542 RepID=A0A9W7FKH8_9STRA|nr:hypothetical protein TrVE_jg4960 [Triparma verrucosa]
MSDHDPDSNPTPTVVDLSKFCCPSQSLSSFISSVGSSPNPTPAPAVTLPPPPPNPHLSHSPTCLLPISIPPPPQSSSPPSKTSYLNYTYFNNSPPMPNFVQGNTNVSFVDSELRRTPRTPRGVPITSPSSLVFEIEGPSGVGKTSTLTSVVAQFVVSNYHTYHEAVLANDEATEMSGQVVVIDTECGVFPAPLKSVLEAKILSALNKQALDQECREMVEWAMQRIHIIRPSSTAGGIAALESLRHKLSTVNPLNQNGKISQHHQITAAPTLLCLDSLSAFHYHDKYVDNLGDFKDKTANGVQSGLNDFFLLLTRLRNSCDVVVFATKPHLYRKKNENSTSTLWNNSVTHSVTLNNVIDGGDEDRAGYDKVAVSSDGTTTTPFKFDGRGGIL